MIRSIYSVYDLKAKTFCNPFVMENDDCALREFATAANDKNSTVGKYPFDYCLYRVAQFDFELGTMQSVQPVSLGIAAGYVVQTIEENQNV